MSADWMIYGAYGYTGRMIAEAAVERGLRPVVAGRDAASLAALAGALSLESRVCALDDAAALGRALQGCRLVLHCAGPFSATARPMIEACLAHGVHYLDITGEIAVFELAHSLDQRAREAGVLLLPGAGFDVVPTDCVAATLAAAMPDAQHLALGFDSRGAFSRGTALTSLEGLVQGGRMRRDGRIVTVPLANKTRQIDFGGGEKLAMSIPWGDVATAGYSTGVANVEVYIPSSPRQVARLRRLHGLRRLLGLAPVQALGRWMIRSRVSGPDARQRAASPTFVWGETTNAAGRRCTARLRTPNGYDLTVSAALGIVTALREGRVAGTGYRTPSQLLGAGFVTGLPGCSAIEVGCTDADSDHEH